MLEQNKQFEVMQLILLPAVMLCDVITEQVSATKCKCIVNKAP